MILTEAVVFWSYFAMLAACAPPVFWNIRSRPIRWSVRQTVVASAAFAMGFAMATAYLHKKSAMLADLQMAAMLREPPDSFDLWNELYYLLTGGLIVALPAIFCSVAILWAKQESSSIRRRLDTAADPPKPTSAGFPVD